VSVWDGDGHKLTWNATVNGLEGAVALYAVGLYKDSLIALHEINQGDPHAVDKALYAIANGAGKQRAVRTSPRMRKRI